MTHEQKEALDNIVVMKTPVVTVEDLENKKDRTLLYGYTCERDTWHVYLKDGVIHTVLYNAKFYPMELSVVENSDFIPNKRVYPCASDFEFCALLVKKGIHIPFTSFVENREQKQFHGEIL